MAQRLSAPSFVFARYATGSATALFAARSFGPGGGFVALVQNPQTQYREMIGGVFTQGNWGRQSLLLALAYADASDASYVQVYAAPSLVAGALSFSATVETYLPLDQDGVRQLSVNPASLQLRVWKTLAVGVAATLDVAPGVTAQRRLGPVVEWGVPWGSLRIELLDRSTGRATELRTAVFAQF